MVRLLGVIADDVVMDTTCGCGTLLLTATGMTGCKVAGVEYFDQMYNVAIINAAVNGIDYTQIRSRIDDDGYQTIKKCGRIDIENKWANDYEGYWVDAVKSNNDQRFGTHRVVDPAVRLSYPPKERETVVTQDDHMRTAVNYYISTTGGVTIEELKAMLKAELDGILYGLSGGDDNEQN